MLKKQLTSEMAGSVTDNHSFFHVPSLKRSNVARLFYKRGGVHEREWGLVILQHKCTKKMKELIRILE